jgi:hypothetical protein
MKENEFANGCNAGKRLYTLSENSLDWVSKHITDATKTGGIQLMKDKVAFREKLSSQYPDFFFQRIRMSELNSFNVNEELFPLVLKPAVGFFSVGVYTITNLADWQNALDDIAKNASSWGNAFPESVVDGAEFILEQYIRGTEYAVDAYFDSNGKAVILNILKHEFASMSDVSDRLYYTSKEIIQEHLQTFEDYLNEVNGLLGARSFPFHAEVRLAENGRIIPIELNPLRFAGWCCTDLSYFAYGFHTYDYYLHDQRPDWKQLLEGKEEKLYTLIVLDKPSSYDGEQLFDYDLLQKDFEKVLCLRKLSYKEEKPFGFLFTETKGSDFEELRRIMHSDLTEYLYKEPCNH